MEEALSIRGIFNKKNGKVTSSYQLSNNYLHNFSDDSSKFIDNSKFPIDTNSGNLTNTNKETQSNEVNQGSFDLQTYKKFLLFLKFQEMNDKYNT